MGRGNMSGVWCGEHWAAFVMPLKVLAYIFFLGKPSWWTGIVDSDFYILR